MSKPLSPYLGETLGDLAKQSANEGQTDDGLHLQITLGRGQAWAARLILVCLLGVRVPLSSQFYNINLKLNREAFQVYSWSNPAGP